MIELGKLEKRHEDFETRHVRVVVISNDDRPTSQETQGNFPHLVVVADTEQNLAKAVQVLHPGAGHHHETTNAPTTILVDGDSTVRWLYRPERVITRLAPDELLAAIDANLPHTQR
jgi:alkyl hydroperoxide reductase subunit AhpC